MHNINQYQSVSLKKGLVSKTHSKVPRNIFKRHKMRMLLSFIHAHHLFFCSAKHKIRHLKNVPSTFIHTIKVIVTFFFCFFLIMLCSTQEVMQVWDNMRASK